MNAVEVIPSAKRLIKSLRDMGYDFSQAVADVVDNSIEAGATLVQIDVCFEGDNSWVRIADNGKGMAAEQLREAMRYGSERAYGEQDLGKFGLGLKTASMSQCQRLSVASRWNSNRADIAGYSWDLEHIEKTNRWEILPLNRTGLSEMIRTPLNDSIGTIVLWERLDRILGYQHPYGENARKRLLQTCREIEEHLGMVFHRFLGGEIRGKRFRLTLNGNDVKPWDPFCEKEPRTKALQTISIPVEHEGARGEVVFEPFVLPPQDDFSSAEAFRLASGPANWNQQQGFYIYRAGRMIQSGGWSNLRAPDEHTKLARVAVKFSPALDEALKINVAKMRVQMPSQIREAVREALIPVLRLAREIYDKKPSRPSNSYSGAGSGKTQVTSENGSDEVGSAPANGEGRASTFTMAQWTRRMLAVATRNEKPVVKAVLRRIGSDYRS